MIPVKAEQFVTVRSNAKHQSNRLKLPSAIREHF